MGLYRRLQPPAYSKNVKFLIVIYGAVRNQQPPALHHFLTAFSGSF